MAHKSSFSIVFNIQSPAQKYTQDWMKQPLHGLERIALARNMVLAFAQYKQLTPTLLGTSSSCHRRIKRHCYGAFLAILKQCDVNFGKRPHGTKKLIQHNRMRRTTCKSLTLKLFLNLSVLTVFHLCKATFLFPRKSLVVRVEIQQQF